MMTREKMIHVDSSNVNSVGYENNELYVEYPSGIYVYHNVPQEVYESLFRAPSIGKFMNEAVKSKYSYSRYIAD